jgi:hypothetical protein
MDAETQTAVRRNSYTFARVTLVLIVILCSGIAICFSSALRAPAGDVHALTLLHALYWFPSLFYLWVLFAIRKAFLDIAGGALFGASIDRGLRHLGWCLVAGGMLSTLLSPWVRSSPMPSGYVDGRTQVFGNNDADLVLALIGVAVLLVSGLLSIASRSHARSIALEAELKGFI